MRWLIGFLVLVACLPAPPLALLRWVDPPTSAFMQHNLARMRADGYPNATNRWQWVDYDRIAATIKLAVVASEDQKFPTHHGFDVSAIRQAVNTAQRGGELRGASTISQQTMKNLFLWHQQSLLRKGLEAWLTVWAELILPKRRILEIYLNIAQFDANVFGVEAASQKFFGIPASELSGPQAALLAVALPAPSRYKVDRPGDYMRERQRWVLLQMRQLGPRYLDQL